MRSLPRPLTELWPLGLFGSFLGISQLLSTYQVSIANEALLAIFVVLGFNLMFGNAGQISLGAAAFLGIGAFGTVGASVGMGLPFPLAVLIGGLLSMVIGVLIGVPSLRLSGHYLIFSTLALHFVTVYLLSKIQEDPSGWFLPSAELFGFELGTDARSWFVLYSALAVFMMWVVHNLLSQRPGRAWTAVKEHPESAAIVGVDVVYWRLAAFAFSALLFGIGGGLQGFQIRHVGHETYTLHLAVLYVVMILVGGMGSILGSILGAVTVVIVPFAIQNILDIGSFPYNLQREQFQLSVLVYGLLLVGVLLFEPGGMAAMLKRLYAWLSSGVPRLPSAVRRGIPLGRLRDGTGKALQDWRRGLRQRIEVLASLRPRLPRPAPQTSGAPDGARSPAVGATVNSGSVDGPLLSVDGLTVAYGGGGAAVQDVSLNVEQGKIVSLLGPNGAGKSTTIRAIAGFLPREKISVSARRIDLLGHDIRSRSALDVTRMGLSFLPQRDKVFNGLTVHDHLRLRLPKDKVARAQVEQEIFDLFPALYEMRRRHANYLSGGERQMLSIALALAGQPSVLLLDEVSLGLAPVAISQISETLQRLSRDLGTTILMVEQNARMALAIADEIYVLVSGRIADFGPGDTWSEERLETALLGTGGARPGQLLHIPTGNGGGER